VRALRGTVSVPGDKSISHRAIIIGALARGETEIINFLPGDDCLSTARAARALGVEVHVDGDRAVVIGRGMDALREPEDVLDAGNSGTTMRLMAGVLAGSPFFSVLTGDKSLRRRPMGRVIEPLCTMGAQITGRCGNAYAPLAIKGGGLRGKEYVSPVASAQVKSAVLLAGLFAEGWTAVVEPAQSRDHTERMLRYFGARVEVDGRRIAVLGRPELRGKKITVPGDISSAVFFIVAGVTVPDADITINNVGINPTRTGALEVLQRMGADITYVNTREVNGEPVADIRVRSSELTGTEIGGDIIPRLIDELPVLAVAAAHARGTTVVRDARELRYKETDRIAAVVDMLCKMGARVEERADGFVVHGGQRLQGTTCDSRGDHRMVMAAAVAGLTAKGETIIEGTDCIKVSYPGFFRTLYYLCVQ